MKVLAIRQKVFDGAAVLGLLGITAGLLAFPSQMVEASAEGVELCFNVLIPSLFPFFVISALTVELGLAERLGRVMAPIMEPLFRVGGCCAPALILGFIGGYPVGARTVISLYSAGKCSKGEAERMLAFCNNSGPAFIFGVVGAGIFSSSAVGLALYLTHVASSVLVGILFRSWGDGKVTRGGGEAVERVPFPGAFVKSVGSSFSSCLGICGFVIFFTVFIRLLFVSGLLEGTAEAIGGLFGFMGLDADWASRLLTGFIELTGGVWSLREVSGSVTGSVAMAAFMLGWAGLSVHCQVLSFLSETGLSARTYILGKLLQGLIAAGLMALTAPLLPVTAPVGAYIAQQVGTLAGLSFASALKVSGLLAGGLLAVFLGTGHFGKTSGKTDRSIV